MVEHVNIFNQRQKALLTVQVSVQRLSIPTVPRVHAI